MTRNPAETVTRREALGLLSAGAAAAAFPGMTGAKDLKIAPPSALAPAFGGRHQPKPLRFDPAKLKGLSEKLIRSHWETVNQRFRQARRFTA